MKASEATLLALVVIALYRFFGYRNKEFLLPRPPPLMPEVELEALPDWIPALESRIVRRDADRELPYLSFAVEVRWKIPVERSLRIRFSASVFDVESVVDGMEPALRPVACLIDRFQERATARYHDEFDVGVVEPGQGFKSWKPVVSIIPASLVPLHPGARQYRLIVLAHDAEISPTIERGFILGDVVWAGAHDFRCDFEAEDHRNFMFQHVASLEVVVQFAVAFGDPSGASARTCPAVEEWIDEHALRIEVPLMPGDRARLTTALDTAWESALAGRSDLPRQVRRLRAICSPKDRVAALDLGLLLGAARHASAAEIARFEPAARELGIEPAVLAGLLARHDLPPIVTAPPPA